MLTEKKANKETNKLSDEAENYNVVATADSNNCAQSNILSQNHAYSVLKKEKARNMDLAFLQQAFPLCKRQI